MSTHIKPLPPLSQTPSSPPLNYPLPSTGSLPFLSLLHILYISLRLRSPSTSSIPRRPSSSLSTSLFSFSTNVQVADQVTPFLIAILSHLRSNLFKNLVILYVFWRSSTIGSPQHRSVGPLSLHCIFSPLFHPAEKKKKKKEKKEREIWGGIWGWRRQCSRKAVRESCRRETVDNGWRWQDECQHNIDCLHSLDNPCVRRRDVRTHTLDCLQSAIISLSSLFLTCHLHFSSFRWEVLVTDRRCSSRFRRLFHLNESSSVHIIHNISTTRSIFPTCIFPARLWSWLC